MENKNVTRLSRRRLIKGGVALLLASWFPGFVQAEEGASAFFQVDRKRIYIAPDDHTDYMWTADEETYRQVFLEMLDYYLDLADTTAHETPQFQSRWNCDGSFWMWTYQKNKSAAEFERLIQAIRSGHISVPLNALCVCLGGSPVEAVLRGMYYPGHMERRFNLRFALAYTIENQTQPYGLVSLWTGSGVKYSWKGVCGCASDVPSLGNREHEIYWWVGPDGSRVLMKWYSLIGKDTLGGYAEAANPSIAVSALDSKCFSPRYDFGIAGAFGYGWDRLEVLSDSFVTVAKEQTNAARQVIVSNELDFFEDFEATYGDRLPSVSASFGNEWELYCASMAEVSAQVKRAVERLRSAEALATLVSLQEPDFMSGRQEARDQAWIDLGLYWEHDWTADGWVSRNERRDWQRRLAGEIDAYVDTLYSDAASALGKLIQRSGSHLRFYVFNPLSWKRTDIADVPYSDSGPVHVVDLSDGQEVPSQIVTVDDQRRLRILAKDVPSVGYKVFEVRSGADKSFPHAPSASASSGIIQNEFYEITLAPRGALTSLKDKTRDNRQFARNIGGYFINDLGSSSGSLAVENAGPVSVTLRATAPNPLSHITRVTLIREVDRIDIRNDINQNFGDIYAWAFGFELADPDVWHEEVGAVIRAKLLAQGGHYSPRNARYDWLTLNHFADMSGSDGVGITLSNSDCYFMQLGHSTEGSLDVNIPQIAPLVGGQVDGSSLGIPNQGGDSHFLQRFALKTHGAYNQVTAMKFALEHQNPLITGVVTGGSAYPATSYSLLTISNPSVLLWALKPSEEGILNGIIARVWNLSASVATFSLALAERRIRYAKRTTHIETPIEAAGVKNGVLAADLNPQQLGTFALHVPVLEEKAYLPIVLDKS